MLNVQIFLGISANAEILEEGSVLKSSLQIGFKNIVSLSKTIVTKELEEIPSSNFNFTNYAKNFGKGGNLSYIGFHLTFFDNTLTCQLDNIGSRARVFWIWQTFKCTPLYLDGKFTHEYYMLDGSKLKLMCDDSACSNCR